MATKQQNAPWAWDFFQRHADDDPDKTIPAQVFLESCPEKVQRKLLAVVEAVAESPPPAFSGGGKWEAMHEMAGLYEVRVDFNNFHYRLFCVLDRNEKQKGLDDNTLVIIDGERKPYRTTIPKKRYAEIRALADEYLGRVPRSICDEEEEDEDDDAGQEEGG